MFPAPGAGVENTLEPIVFDTIRHIIALAGWGKIVNRQREGELATKCPDCGHVSPGEPRICPGCGREARRYDPSRCEFCGSRVTPGSMACENCGAPLHQGVIDPEQTGIPVVPSSTTAIRTGCIVAVAVLIALIAGLVMLFSRSSNVLSRENSGAVIPEKLEETVLDASMPDSIYAGYLEEDRNTVETIWPRVLTDLPDSCYYPSPYDPCAAFRFTVEEHRALVKLEASAPIDLVMTLLREDETGLSYAAWNEDGPSGTDPMILTPLSEGTYIALVTCLGGWEYGRVRFLWSVVMSDIPLVTSDTTFSLSLSNATPMACFDIDIVRGRTYSIRTVSRAQSMDSFVQLTTEGGSVLSDDDSGRNDNCWGDAHLSFTAGPLQEGRAFVVVRPFSTLSPSYSDMDVVFTIGSP